MKINLKKYQHKKKELILKPFPIFSNGTVVGFKDFEIYGNDTLAIYVDDATISKLKFGSEVIIERVYENSVFCFKKLYVKNISGNAVFFTCNIGLSDIVVDGVSDYITESGDHYYKIHTDSVINIIESDKSVSSVHTREISVTNESTTTSTNDFFVINTHNQEDRHELYLNISNVNEPKNGSLISFNFDAFLYEQTTNNWSFYDGVSMYIDDLCVNVDLMASNCVDYYGLKQNEIVEDYYDEIKGGVIPDFINMERTKITPLLVDSNETEIGVVSSLNFYFHFRTRDKKISYDKETLIPTDSWSISSPDDMSGNSFSYWNVCENYNNIGALSDDKLYSSDFIGDLGFNDSDVLNRKKKIKKSFLRLSFFNSNDPLQTSMLFSSTIFLDPNVYYSRYIKLITGEYCDAIKKQFLKSVDNDDDYDNGWGFVLYDGSLGFDNNGDPARIYSDDDLLKLDLSVSSEYDKSSSAEGYNIYLFSDDLPDKNQIRTIYMKVEFNHAGCGKTIPMLLWPKDDSGNSIPLTAKNYYESLYIPVNIVYSTKLNRYVYYINSAQNNLKNKTLNFALFEPKLEPSYGSN